jgi:L-histidine N-alpha-methyltransferase
MNMRDEHNVEHSERLKIHHLTSEGESNNFGRDVAIGLTSKPKTLSPKYFYDELGSHLFEAICCLPEYYLTRSESEILERHIDGIISATRANLLEGVELIELGNGSSLKTRYFIEALLSRTRQLRYLPIDISAPSLARSSKELLQSYPDLNISAYAGDYSSALALLSRNSKSDRTRIVLFLGSSIGNLDGNESIGLLRQVRESLSPSDVLLLGADLKKPAAILVPAYDDSLGVTAAFNLNLLVRINRDLDGRFDLAKFRHRSIYNQEMGRVEMHLVSRQRQNVQIRTIDIEVGFQEGESIHTENSYKYESADLARLAAASDFKLERAWLDHNKWYSFNLLRAV